MRHAARMGYTAGGEGHLRHPDWSDVVVFRLSVANCRFRAPFRLLVARLIGWGVSDLS